jgi:hypothetical protein
VLSQLFQQPFFKISQGLVQCFIVSIKGQIQSNINQFISIQFSEQNAIVNVVNSLVDPSLSIKAVGQAANQFQVNTSQCQTLS